MWLSGDHYKWRLMRCCGIPERYITGDALPYEKYEKFAQAISQSPGNPLYHWVAMELEQVFDIHEPLCPQTASQIWETANEYIKRTALSPRKLLSRFQVEYVATTDDIIDPLTYHEKLCAEPGLAARICPTFRMDTLILSLKSGDRAYFEKLSAASGVQITDGKTLMVALEARLDAFRALGGTLSDIGVAYFPDTACDKEEADQRIAQVLQGKPLTQQAFTQLLGWLYLSLFPLLKERSMVLQLHLGVMRNASSRLYEIVGADAGGDCICAPVSVTALRWLLDTLDRGDKLPRTIVYTLAPDYDGIASLIGAFPGVTLGAA